MLKVLSNIFTFWENHVVANHILGRFYISIFISNWLMDKMTEMMWESILQQAIRRQIEKRYDDAKFMVSLEESDDDN